MNNRLYFNLMNSKLDNSSVNSSALDNNPKVFNLVFNHLRLIRSVTAFKYHNLMSEYSNNIEKILENADITLASEDKVAIEIDQIERFGGKIIFFNDQEYPQELKYIATPPAALTVYGNMELLKRPQLSVIGSRRASLASLHFAQLISKELGLSGQVIVSGLASGVDTAAHKGSLSTGTIAVLGCGINMIYPLENEELYYQIKENGLLISEFPFDYPVKRESFPIRNRIVSGLSWGTLVVEAEVKSGSFITATYATAQGKEVFAVPGHPLDTHSRGCNALLKDGAILVESVDDILNHYTDQSAAKSSEQLLFAEHYSVYTDQYFENTSTDKDQDDLRASILNRLSSTPVYIDGLVRDLKQPVGLIRSILFQLEMEKEVYIDACDTVVRVF